MIIATLRSLKWADFFYNALVDPRTLYRNISSNDPRPFGLSFVVPAIVVFIGILSESIITKQTPFFIYKITNGWILGLLIIILKIIIMASVMDLFAQFLGFQGKVKEIICIINYSLFPQVLLLPLLLIIKILNFQPTFYFFYLLFSFGLFVWSAFIAIEGLSEMYSTGFGKSFLIFIFPYVLFILILFFILVLGVINILGYFSI